MNTWMQESPKSELRLKSYEGLKLIDKYVTIINRLIKKRI
jgi:hypothetical protein